MSAARNTYWNRLVEHQAKILVAWLIVGYVSSAAHAQVLNRYSDDSLYRSPLKQALGQKRHPRYSADPYMALIERSDPYYQAGSTSVRSAPGSNATSGGTMLPHLAAGSSELSSRIGLGGAAGMTGAGQFMKAGGVAGAAAKLRRNTGNTTLALPGQMRTSGR